MVSAARFNYVLFVGMGVFWMLSGLFYLSGGPAGTEDFMMFGVHIDNFNVLFGVFEVLFGLFWLYVIISRYDGEVSFRS